MSRMKIFFRLIIAGMILSLVIMAMPFMAQAATCEAVELKASDCTDDMCASRFQFRFNAAVKYGDEISFYIKLYSEAEKIRIRTDDKDFGYDIFDDGEVSNDIGDGWYAVRVFVRPSDDYGNEDTGFAADKWGVTIYIETGCEEGDAILIRDMKIGSKTYTAAELAGVVEVYYARPIFDVSVQSVSVADSSVKYDWPAVNFDDPTPTPPGTGYTTPEFTGTLPTYDMTPYTWQINTAKGGAANLPAVVPAATGQYANVTNLNDQLLAALRTTEFTDANNMIFLISDGFGVNHLKVTEHYSGNIIINDMPHRAESVTPSYPKPGEGDVGTFVTTDSGAGGTALACGIKTRYSAQGLDAYESPVPSISEVLREKYGKIIGVLTTGWAYDSTPADFGGCHAYRGDQDTIAKQMITFAPDLWIGEGVSDYSSVYSSLVSTTLLGQDIGMYTDWSKGIAATNDKVWISFKGDVRYNDAFSTSRPTISQMMAYGLTWLQAKSKANNDVGFFMMFENGMTDDAGHNNKLEQTLGETRASGEMTAIALKFACENPDTIVIHTADHETGGLMLNTGWETNMGACKYTTSGHSKQNVEVYAIGKNTEMFDGQVMENCQVGKVTAYLMGIEDFGTDEEQWGIGEISQGIQIDVNPVRIDENRIVGKALHVRAQTAVKKLSVTIPGANCQVHGMMELALRVPDKATYLVIYGNSTSYQIIAQSLDKTLNYNAEHDQYALTFKPTEEVEDLIISVNGDFQEGDEIIIDSIITSDGSISFEDYDPADLELSEGAEAIIAEVQEPTVQEPTDEKTADVTEPTAEPVPGDTRDDTLTWIIVGVVAAVVIAAAVIAAVVISRKKKK